MSLLDEIRNERVKKGPACTVSSTLLRLDKPDAADLIAAMNDIGIEATVISRVMAARGIRLPVDAIRRHRRGVCFCEPR